MDMTTQWGRFSLGIFMEFWENMARTWSQVSLGACLWPVSKILHAAKSNLKAGILSPVYIFLGSIKIPMGYLKTFAIPGRHLCPAPQKCHIWVGWTPFQVPIKFYSKKPGPWFFDNSLSPHRRLVQKWNIHGISCGFGYNGVPKWQKMANRGLCLP